MMIVAATAATAASAAEVNPTTLPQPPSSELPESLGTAESDELDESEGVVESEEESPGFSLPSAVTFNSTSNTSLSNALLACTRTAILPAADGVTVNTPASLSSPVSERSS